MVRMYCLQYQRMVQGGCVTKEALSIKKHSRCMMKTVRQRLNTAPLCKDTPDGIALTFNDDYPHIRTYVYMFQRLNLLRKAA